MFFESLFTKSNKDAIFDSKKTIIVSGSVNFSKYIALGGSFTSGFCDGVLYIDAQKESYPCYLI
ncbi:hypothetical protein BBD32_12275 [Elizabethkingia anophelis]|uniref:Uncharacterized protein n=1 Tax=Elizabethkingia anophelis TaxID=1117645 RepID=A0AAU8UV47_9FLAO|nr:hypothetical protein BBD32_12275 [Elizabethkingia anophelis]OPB60437.1 hypothetical protein BAY11_17825 [Elizabethkingia anophelis]